MTVHRLFARALGLSASLTVMAGLAAPSLALADHGPGTAARADSHAPIGVMGDHMHKAGEVMLAYRFMRMSMDGNRDGTDEVSPAQIATTVPNRFFGRPMQPPTLRVVPVDMTMDMHMLGAMYAPTDWLTLMAMGMYIEKTMDHVTFQGPMGTDQLGSFTTEADGWGDTKLSGLFRLFEDDRHHVHVQAGISLPTGSIEEEDRVLAPTGMTPTLRLPYPMQLGSGTYDLLPGLTYSGLEGLFGWGAQYAGTVRIGENDEGYTLGDQHQITAWGSYLWAPWASTSLRATGRTTDSIDGIDPRIVAPVQTADPDNQGGDVIELGVGVNLLGTQGFVQDHRLALELVVPVYQDLNGPQLETDWTLTVGWQYAF